jgi:folate-binding Fe-S cluster repair protein YgfZ
MGQLYWSMYPNAFKSLTTNLRDYKMKRKVTWVKVSSRASVTLQILKLRSKFKIKKAFKKLKDKHLQIKNLLKNRPKNHQLLKK